MEIHNLHPTVLLSNDSCLVIVPCVTPGGGHIAGDTFIIGGIESAEELIAEALHTAAHSTPLNREEANTQERIDRIWKNLEDAAQALGFTSWNDMVAQHKTVALSVGYIRVLGRSYLHRLDLVPIKGTRGALFPNAEPGQKLDGVPSYEELAAEGARFGRDLLQRTLQK